MTHFKYTQTPQKRTDRTDRDRSVRSFVSEIGDQRSDDLSSTIGDQNIKGTDQNIKWCRLQHKAMTRSSIKPSTKQHFDVQRKDQTMKEIMHIKFIV